MMMIRYCSNMNIECPKEVTEDSMMKKTLYSKTSSSSVKECLKEYSLQDKVEALKNVLNHNEKSTQDSMPHKNVKCDMKELITVKECLQGERKTPFQALVSELKNTVMTSYWNKEVGKTRYQVPNLPIGMNLLETTFGKKLKSDGTVAELISPKRINSEADDSVFGEMYRKSHSNYQPSEQIHRDYKLPFDEYFCFGVPRNVNSEGKRVKKLLTWINTNPTTIVNSIQSNFLNRTQARIGEVKNIQNVRSRVKTVYGKTIEKDAFGAAECLKGCCMNNEAIAQQKYLQHLNTLRHRLKKRVPQIPFTDICDELVILDKNYTNSLPEAEVFAVLRKYEIQVNEELFLPLLDVLEIRKKGNVNYTKLLNLLNWRHDVPTLPKTNDIPLEYQYYTTTYNETIGNIENINTTNIPAAGIPPKLEFPFVSDNGNLGKRASAYHLIFPSIFTMHSISRADLLKTRNKEEIKSIFENIGIEITNNSFDLLWEEGLKKDGLDGVCVETFQNLLHQCESITTGDK